MYYFNYKDELYHYGRKGMKWGENIFTKGLDSLTNKIREADSKVTGQPKSSLSIPTYSEFKSTYNSGSGGTKAKASSTKKASNVINMEQRLIDARARILASAGNAKSSSGKGGGKGRGGSSRAKGSTKAAAPTEKKTSTKEEKEKVEEVKEQTKNPEVQTKTESNVQEIDYSDFSADELISKIMNGEFETLEEMKSKLGDRYEDILEGLKKKLGVDEANGETAEKAFEEKITTINGESVVKRLYDTIFPNSKKG